MFKRLYRFIIKLFSYFKFNKIKKNDDEYDMDEILIKYDEIYTIENPFIM